MKKTLLVSLVLILILLLGCGKEEVIKSPTTAQQTVDIVVAQQTNLSPSEGMDENQMNFLNDMAEGIRQRLSDTTDSTNSSTEENAALYAKLVGFELSRIEKYENTVFNDVLFNTLAHDYISACQMQHTATENYRNTSLYESLWNGGLSIRAGIIVFFYQNYNLPISDSEASSYVSYIADYISTSDDSTLDLLDYFPSDDNDVSLKKGDLSIVGASGEITYDEYYNTSNFEYSFTIKNESQYPLTGIEVNCAILDENMNILGETNAWEYLIVKSNQSVDCKSSFDLADYPNAKYLQINSYTYDGNGDYIVQNLAVVDSESTEYTLEIK